MNFEGKYCPPKSSKTVIPIPLFGPGKCRVDEAGLEVRGQQARRVELFYLVVFGSLAMGAFGLRYAPTIPMSLWYGIIAGYTALIVSAIFAGRHMKKQTRAVTLNIPWRSVKSVGDDPEDSETVRMVIDQFKPAGTLFFSPAKGAASFIKAVRQQLRR